MHPFTFFIFNFDVRCLTQIYYIFMSPPIPTMITDAFYLISSVWENGWIRIYSWCFVFRLFVGLWPVIFIYAKWVLRKIRLQASLRHFIQSPDLIINSQFANIIQHTNVPLIIALKKSISTNQPQPFKSWWNKPKLNQFAFLRFVTSRDRLQTFVT